MIVFPDDSVNATTAHRGTAGNPYLAWHDYQPHYKKKAGKNKTPQVRFFRSGWERKRFVPGPLATSNGLLAGANRNG